MFRVYLTVYEILVNEVGATYYEEARDVLDGYETCSPREVVQLFHRMPDNSEMIVIDEWEGYDYGFSKGPLLKSKEHSDIEQFIHRYIF